MHKLFTEMRKKRALSRTQSPSTLKDKSLTTTTTTVEIQEIQTEILEQRITKPQRQLGLKALSDLKAQLSIERRIEYETYQVSIVSLQYFPREGGVLRTRSRRFKAVFVA